MNTKRKVIAIAARLAIALVFVAAVSHAQTSRPTGSNYHHADNHDAEINLDGARIGCDVASTSARPGREMDGFEFTRNIGEGLIKEFDQAWRQSLDGTNGRESVILIFRMTDGSYTGRAQGFTNEYDKFTFRWNPAALAIVHTHPNHSDPRPGAIDKRVADRYGVPNFTITSSGMYVYDPATKKTSKVLNGLDWLNLSRWKCR
jgi:hypothetical protein